MAKPPPLPTMLPRQPTPQAPDLGKRKYRAIRRVGRWLVGNVYSGEDLSSGKPVTVLFPDVVAAEVEPFVAAMNDEIGRNRLLVGLPILGFAYVGQTIDKRVFTVLPDARGTTLDGFVRERGTPPPIAALQLTVMLADALMRLHYRSRFIGELRPWTVLLPSDRSETLQVIDLGITRGLFSRSIAPPKASVNYASPNVRSGGEPGVADDIYTLGALLYFALCGQHPPPSGTPLPSRRGKLGAFSSFLDGMVVQAMAPEPEKGIDPLTDMLEFSRALRGLRDLHQLSGDGQRAVLMLRSEGRGARPPPVPGGTPAPLAALGFVETGPTVLTRAEIESIETQSVAEMDSVDGDVE